MTPIPKEAKSELVRLPEGTRTAPLKRKTKLDKATYEKLSKLGYPDWDSVVRELGDDAFDIKYATKTRPKLSVAITMSPCFDCLPMELPKWKEKSESLKLFLDKDLQRQPDTVFEVGETKLGDAPMIYTYQLGYYSGPGQDGRAITAYSDTYVLYYNDSVNQIRVRVSYSDDRLQDAAALARVAPREQLDKIAHAFMDAFTHAWVTS
jgi:hypothetical protein